MGTGEMTQKLRAFAVLPEDLCLSLSGYIVSHNCLKLQFRHSLLVSATGYANGTRTYVQVKHTCT